MSYEGFTEYLCINGHYHTQDCYATLGGKCPECKTTQMVWHDVDMTNGYEEDNSSTYEAPKIHIRNDYIPAKDEFGVEYHRQVKIYSVEITENSPWKLINYINQENKISS